VSTAAPPRRRVLSRAAFETRTLLANGEQLLVSLVLPALALLGLVLTDVPDLGPGPRPGLATAGVVALAVVSTAFTGQAIATGFDRRAGVLRQLGSTPLGRDGLLVGKAGAVLAVLAVQVVVLGGLGVALGARPAPSGLVPALVSVVLGAAALVALALLLAGTLRAEAVLAVANLVWVVLLGLGTLVPTDRLPGALGGAAALLPSGALGDALRTALVDGGWPWGAWAVLLGWAVVAGAAAVRWFRWAG
jgi:ABC-2 type transport system permease protein